MDQLFGEACSLLVRGEFEGAAHAFSEILSQGDHPTIRHNYGLSLECCKKFQDAAKEYSTVIREFPEYVPSYLGMANCYFYEGDLEHCEGMLRAAREVDATDPRAAILLSEVLLLRGKESEGIAQHLEALDLIDGAECHHTTNHAKCYGDFGVGGYGFYSFWEGSMVHRDAFPQVPKNAPRADGKIVLLVVAHADNAAEVARRLEASVRSEVYVVALDDVSAAIVGPEIRLSGVTYRPQEVPAIQVHLARELLRTLGAAGVVVPGSDAYDAPKLLAWATEQKEALCISASGDLAARKASALDPRRIPPLLQNASSDIFAKVFA